MINLDPMKTTNAAGLFGASTVGKVAGCLYPKPNARYNLRAGTLAASVTALIYGGVALSVATASQANQSVGSQDGPVLTLATALANFCGFAVSDQSFAGVMTPVSTAPLFSEGQSISFVEPGSESVIALPISAANAATLLGVSQYTPVSWDFTNQVVIPYTGAGANAGAIPGGGPGGVAKIVGVYIGNSYVVVPNQPANGQADWNAAGSVVVLEI